ncbi:MAG: DUF87 domain-containing protein [Pseudomonadota bacterium]|nr:DUF87 domain-containing protein [Pseudomonadota bacterium]
MAEFITTDKNKHASAAATPPPRRRTQGHVVDCDGARAVIMAHVDDDVDFMENYWTVGQLVSIHEGDNRVVGQAYHIESAGDRWAETGVNTLLIHIELIGEIRQNDGGRPSFSSGIANYPRMGAIAHRIRAIDLEAMYENDAETTIDLGHLAQEVSIPAKIDLERLTSRHFAIVGSTGTGKSTSVALILHKIIARRPDLRVLILDPHNEFSTAFPREAVVNDARSLHLPFWLFTFDEFREIVFRGQRDLETESELLRDLIAEAKQRYEGAEQATSSLVRRATKGTGFTADSPVPYRLADLFKIIDERLGHLEGKAIKPILKQLRDRLTTISEDPRFAFTFAHPNAGGDRMKEVVGDLFRVPQDSRPVSVIDMSELPSEVVNSVASVLCRMAFDLAVASQGGIQTLVICEEAHRYVPANHDAGFWPTRQSVARIAKEGRKYGVYLGIVTQRPSELDPTILSQCNTIFAMRLANQNDQKIIGDAMTNGAQTSINFISSLADRECIAFGEAVKTPMRMFFETIAPRFLPGSRIKEMQQQARQGQTVDLASVIRRMRDANTRLQTTVGNSVMPAPISQREPGMEEPPVPEVAGLESPPLAGDLSEHDPSAHDRGTSHPAAPVPGVAANRPSGDGTRTVEPAAMPHRQVIEPMPRIRNWAGSKDSGGTKPVDEHRPANPPTRGNSLVNAFRSRP